MNSLEISRRSFIRLLAGLFAFLPVAGSLTASPLQSPDGSALSLSREALAQSLKARIAKGAVLAVQGDSVLIKDRYADKLRLVITDESLVWKGKYNRGKDFSNYSHMIEPGDTIIARGERKADQFMVEKIYANISNAYITVDEVSTKPDEIVIYYTDKAKRKGAVKVRADYLGDKTLYQRILDNHQQLRGRVVQIIGLSQKDGTTIATNLFM